ncbi:hypothetical protein BTJ68_14348 [Hortaea werneckii EXF-2000]|uniref:PAC1-like LisH-like dimerisation domain-containing protein n=1 Tax=Hortaea werneckii EXF-2000 TaxID=1157616 RepID=A0A1Z5SMW3_HORWE|nr:hypothetical protein BTJ68_14348 [Hortaea werneckii EXF-2000]
MSNLLTSRQAEELHKSLIAYLAACGHTTAAQAVRDDVNLPESSFDPATTKKYEACWRKNGPVSSAYRRRLWISNPERPNVAAKGARTAYLTIAPPTITSVAFHPLFSSLASGSEDCTIKIWDYELGELERTLKSHTKAVLDVDFGGPRGGTLLASCSSDLTRQQRTLHPLRRRRRPLSGNLLASASRDRTIRIWDVTTGYCLRTLRGHGDWVRSLSPSLDGRYLVSTSSDQTARLWDLSLPDSNALKQTFLAHDHVVETCALAPGSTYPHLAALAGLKKPPPSTSTAEFLATGGRDKLIKIFSTNGICLKTLSGHDNWIRALAFHPGGKYLLSASDDKTIRCWDLAQEGKCVRVVEAGDHFVSALRWAPSLFRDPAVAAVGRRGRMGWGMGEAEEGWDRSMGVLGRDRRRRKSR